MKESSLVLLLIRKNVDKYTELYTPTIVRG